MVCMVVLETMHDVVLKIDKHHNEKNMDFDYEITMETIVSSTENLGDLIYNAKA